VGGLAVSVSSARVGSLWALALGRLLFALGSRGSSGSTCLIRILCLLVVTPRLQRVFRPLSALLCCLPCTPLVSSLGFSRLLSGISRPCYPPSGHLSDILPPRYHPCGILFLTSLAGYTLRALIPGRTFFASLLSVALFTFLFPVSSLSLLRLSWRPPAVVFPPCSSPRRDLISSFCCGSASSSNSLLQLGILILPRRLLSLPAGTTLRLRRVAFPAG